MSYFDIIGATTTETQKRRQALMQTYTNEGRQEAGEGIKAIHSCRKTKMPKPGTQVKEKRTEARHSPRQVRKQGRQANWTSIYTHGNNAISLAGRQVRKKKTSTCISHIGR